MRRGRGTAAHRRRHRRRRSRRLRGSAWQTRASTAWTNALRSKFSSHQVSPVSCLFPCAGFDAPGSALRALEIDYTLAGAWEIARAPSRLLRSQYACQMDKLHLEGDGDVLDTRPEDVPAAEVLVAGPPCPPWSRMGKRKGWSDTRAKVFLHVLRWITSLSRRGLRCFVLENVNGIRDESHGRCPADLILRRLKHGLPTSWEVEVLVVNSQCTAQSRGRTYIVGSRRPVPGMARDLCESPRVTIEAILLACCGTKGELPSTQREKLARYLAKLRPQLHCSAYRGKFAVFEVDRDPRKKRCPLRLDGLTPCMRAGAGKLWVVSLGFPRPKICRAIHPAERCLLQGLSPNDIPREGLSEQDVVVGCGNAMTVPVIGTILNAILLVA